MSLNARVLIISDLHIPYHHKDVIPFLTYLKKWVRPDKVILTGDEVDYHSISFHDKDPELFSASQELEMAKETLKLIYEIFPEADVLESNHGSLVYRKGKFHGLPRSVFKSYSEILEAPPGWKWHDDITLRLSDGRDCYFTHGKISDGLRLSKNMCMNVVQGHFHSIFEIKHWSNPVNLYWSMTVGCLIDRKSLAFAYNKAQLERPILGVGIILDGRPHLVPMLLDEDGNWIRKIL